MDAFFNHSQYNRYAAVLKNPQDTVKQIKHLVKT